MKAGPAKQSVQGWCRLRTVPIACRDKTSYTRAKLTGPSQTHKAAPHSRWPSHPKYERLLEEDAGEPDCTSCTTGVCCPKQGLPRSSGSETLGLGASLCPFGKGRGNAKLISWRAPTLFYLTPFHLPHQPKERSGGGGLWTAKQRKPNVKGGPQLA